MAQENGATTIEGYITAVRDPGSFDLNGTQIRTSPLTLYGVIGGKAASDSYAPRGALAPGVYVQITGPQVDGAVNARQVLVAGDWNRKIEGFGVIDRVIAAGPELVFQSDGYRIRIAPATVTKFGAGLTSLADVGAGTWLRYEGRRGDRGVLLASAVTFAKARQIKVKPAEPDTLPTEPSIIDSNGTVVSIHTKVRLGDAGWCGWHKVVMDSAIQERVRRVGLRVIPQYQKQLPDDSPSKIHFRIFVVDEPVFREDIECSEGLILVPRTVVDRLGNDDQLAAILANGVAYTLEAQSARLYAEVMGLEGAEIAGYLAGDFVPGVEIGTLVGGKVVSHEIQRRMQEQAGRIALTLMADAGYDPRQAPEAWRLLGPEKPAKDGASLKYPSRAGYQLGILKLEAEPPHQPDAAVQ